MNSGWCSCKNAHMETIKPILGVNDIDKSGFFKKEK